MVGTKESSLLPPVGVLGQARDSRARLEQTLVAACAAGLGSICRMFAYFFL